MRAWLSGGWAEELLGLAPPRSHADIDLFYPADNFTALDRVIARTEWMREITAKHFPHKRAVERDGIMIEFTLLRPRGDGYETAYFGGTPLVRWPPDALTGRVSVRGRTLRVASAAALALNRENHVAVARAYAEWRRAPGARDRTRAGE